VSKKFVFRATRLVDSEVGILVKRELAKRTDPDRIARSILLLKSGNAVLLKPIVATTRLETLLTKLPRLMGSQSKRRRNSFQHLFSGGARSEAERSQYHHAARELERLLETMSTQQLRQHHPILERHGQLMYDQLAGTIDDYDSLKIETGTFNDILRKLYPKQAGTHEVLDAHHIIEERTYEMFKDTWTLLGWDSPGKMPAIPLPREYHRRSPKRLQSIGKLAQEVREGKGVSSLSQELIKNVDLTKIKSPEELIDKYVEFYTREGMAKDVIPLLNAVKREITRRRTAAALVKQKPQ
jgi:hypothetical protein